MSNPLKHQDNNKNADWPAWGLLIIGICGIFVITFQKFAFKKHANLKTYVESKGLEVETSPFTYRDIDDTEFINPNRPKGAKSKPKTSKPDATSNDKVKPKFFHERISSNGSLIEDSVQLSEGKLTTQILLGINTPYGTVYIPYTDSSQSSSMPQIPELPSIDPIQP